MFFSHSEPDIFLLRTLSSAKYSRQLQSHQFLNSHPTKNTSHSSSNALKLCIDQGISRQEMFFFYYLLSQISSKQFIYELIPKS